MIVAVAGVLAVLAAACSVDAGIDPGEPDADSASSSTGDSEGSESDADGSEPDTSTESETDPQPDSDAETAARTPYESVDQAPEELAAALAELDGKLAIGLERSIAVSRPDGRAYIEVEGDPSRLNGQPTWSRDGTKLVWGSASTVSQEARIQNFDDDGVVEGDPERVSVPGPPVFYFQWSSDDSQIVYLRNSPRGSTVEVGVITPERRAAWLTDGDPFFVSWSPEDEVLAAHIADEQISVFDSSEASFLIPGDAEDEEPESPDPVVGRLLAEGGGFSAPAWLDANTLLAVVKGWLSAISVGDRTVEALLQMTGPIRFVVSPDRSKVALQATGDLGSDQPIEASFNDVWLPRSGIRPAQSSDPLVVFDLETGQSVVVTEERAVAWEWSPDGSKLAWLGFDGPLVQRQARWRFWSADGPLAGNETVPTLMLTDKELVNYLPFFAQYVQSVNRWSPDSSAFALSGTSNGRQGIWIQFVDRADPAVLVAPGDFVTWGPGPTPPPTAGRSPA
jgi:WD40 repeat protein